MRFIDHDERELVFITSLLDLIPPDMSVYLASNRRKFKSEREELPRENWHHYCDMPYLTGMIECNQKVKLFFYGVRGGNINVKPFLFCL